MSWEAWFTLFVIALVLVALIRNRVGADVVTVGGASLLLLAGVLTPEEALAGLSNPGVITIAVLYVVVAGLQETGVVAWIGHRVLGRPRTLTTAMVRLTLPVAVISAFMNNTPLVAMMVPATLDWARKLGRSASRFLIPLSYASILGGTLTLIGTSTNLVVSGLWLKEGFEPLGFFEIAWLGIPSAAIGLTYLILFGNRILPERTPPVSLQDDPRSYTVEMIVDERSPIAGQTVEAAGLRHLPGLFLAEIERDGAPMPAVSPLEELQEGDRLVFVGVVESILDLQKIRGLTPAPEQVFKLNTPRGRRCLVEAVVSDTCPLVGRTIRAGRFRNRYNAVVIAVARNGERVKGKIGDIVVRVGDTLLLETHGSFAEQQRNSRDFFLVSAVENSTPPRHERRWIAIAIVVGMVILGAAQPMGITILHAAMLAAGLMLMFRCVTATVARRSVEWSVLIVIAAALALGVALEVTGLAEMIAHSAVAIAGGNPWLTLVIVYGVTMLLTEMITNNAAAALVFPIALNAATELGVDFRPFAFSIMMAASASFSTPIGYQTNLMVMGPGGYRFTDYFRIGAPLNLTMWVTTVILAPLIWKF
ncbi:MAG: SLC13 family permease [Phycisphaerales bacterium]